jgi:hypothetical protein
MRSKLIVTILFFVLLVSVPASGHHGFGGTYDVSKEVTIKGKIVQVLMRSPHSVFVIDVDDAGGKSQRWSIEGASVTQFARLGFPKDAFKVGDPIEIIGNPTRTEGATKARMVKITRMVDGKSGMFDLTGEALGVPSDAKHK